MRFGGWLDYSILKLNPVLWLDCRFVGKALTLPRISLTKTTRLSYLVCQVKYSKKEDDLQITPMLSIVDKSKNKLELS